MNVFLMGVKRGHGAFIGVDEITFYIRDIRPLYAYNYTYILFHMCTLGVNKICIKILSPSLCPCPYVSISLCPCLSDHHISLSFPI